MLTTCPCSCVAKETTASTFVHKGAQSSKEANIFVRISLLLLDEFIDFIHTLKVMNNLYLTILLFTKNTEDRGGGGRRCRVYLLTVQLLG